MRHTVQSLLTAVAFGAMVAVSTAHASPDPEANEPEIHLGGDHGDAGHATDAHGDAGHGAEGEHGEGDHGGEHHVCYSCDDDHDGTANWMDSDAGEAFVATGTAFHAVNLVLFFGLIWWGAGATIRDSLHSRAVGIKTDIGEAAKVRDEAKAHYDAILARMASLEADVAEMTSRAEADGKAEEARIAERAQKAAASIAETTQRQMRDEAARARRALREEAVEIAVELAQGILTEKVEAADHRRMAQQFLDTLKADGDAHV